jgi:hypothetical protein
MLWRKVLATTIIASALTVLVNWIISAQIISFGMSAG